MAVTLVEVLKGVIDTEGKTLTEARKDLKTIRGNAIGIKASRKLIAAHLRVLKGQRLEIDRKGGGANSAYINAEINFMRQVLNDITEEYAMVRIQLQQCTAYIKQQHAHVVGVDALWEKAKADETAEQA